MRFILNMAYREVRASWHRLLFFFVCIAIGVGSIIALRSLIQNVRTSVARESRALLTADVMTSSNSAMSAEARAILEREYRSPLVTDHTRVVELATMLRPLRDQRAAAKMVELKGVEPRRSPRSWR